jgi:hypothetical protein
LTPFRAFRGQAVAPKASKSNARVRPNCRRMGGDGSTRAARPCPCARWPAASCLLDFWTYGCINCLHIQPDLKKLERKYAGELVVIGVHSAKFRGEGDTENIRNAILRQNIEHPVFNDHDMRVWQAYGCRRGRRWS